MVVSCMNAMTKQMEKRKTKEKKNKETRDKFSNCFFPLIFYFQKEFSIFETKKIVWQPKIDRKRKWLSKLNL